LTVGTIIDVQQLPGTISLGQGVAYYGPPAEAIGAIETFLADVENHKYRLVQGIPELLDAIQAKLATENDISIEGSRIVVTAGANMGFVNAVLAITDPGDEIIIQLPYYFNHEMAIAIADCKAVCVPTDDDYQLQVDVSINFAGATIYTTSAMKLMSILLTMGPGTFRPARLRIALNILSRFFPYPRPMALQAGASGGW
jgi:aspartate/methionine/tyrosine aminotransferase